MNTVEPEGIAEARKKVEAYDNRERWFLWECETRWSLDGHPGNVVLAGDGLVNVVGDFLQVLENVEDSPDNYTEISKEDTKYILDNPGDRWEFRKPARADAFLSRSGDLMAYSGETPTESSLRGMRWCTSADADVADAVATGDEWWILDVPPVCWLRKNSHSESNLVTGVDPLQVRTCEKAITYRTLAEEYTWSADLVSWNPCTKEGLKTMESKNEK